MNIWNDFKVLSRFMQKWIHPPACSDHGLHRILSSYWLAHCYLMRKSTKVQIFFVWIAEWCNSLLTSCNPKVNWYCISPAFWSSVRRKRWSGSELWSCFKYSELKSKKYKIYSGLCPIPCHPMLPLSCRSNLAGRYL